MNSVFQEVYRHVQIVKVANILGKGRGVVAARNICVGEEIEAAPVIVLPQNELENIKKTVLFHYYFQWGGNFGAICLGNGSLYNHSAFPNCKYVRDFENNLIRFITIRDIKCGEEICTNYHGDEHCKRELYFERKS